MVAKKTGKQIEKGKKLKTTTLTHPAKLLRGALTRPGAPGVALFTRPVAK